MRARVPQETLGAFALVLVAALLAFVLSLAGGCGASTPQELAQASLTATARGVAETDEVLAARYTEASQEALEAVESMEAFRETMRPMDRAEEALRGARTTLLATQAGLDVWIATGDDASFMRVVKCLAGELDVLALALEATGKVEIPQSLRLVLGLGATYGSRLCREGADQ